MFTQPSFRFPILLCIIILLASCNSNNSTAPVKTDSTGISATDSVAVANKINASPLPKKLIGSYLDTLWVDADSFSKLNGVKLAFRFYIDTSESILMNAWPANSSDNYPPGPVLILSKGEASKFQYQAGDYLGNLLLSMKEVDKINSLIKSDSAQYVLFVPIDPAKASFQGQVTDSIYVTRDDPRAFVVGGAVKAQSTGIATNPSPPGTAH